MNHNINLHERCKHPLAAIQGNYLGKMSMILQLMANSKPLAATDIRLYRKTFSRQETANQPIAVYIPGTTITKYGHTNVLSQNDAKPFN